MPLLLGPVRGSSAAGPGRRAQGAGKGRRVSRAKEWVELQARTYGRYGKNRTLSYMNGNGELTASAIRHTFERVSNTQLARSRCDEMAADLLRSDLIVSPPDDLESMIDSYNTTLSAFVDKHVPLRTKRSQERRSARRFDRECRKSKRLTRKLDGDGCAVRA